MKEMLKSISAIAVEAGFSGTALVKRERATLAEVSFGYANRSDHIKNNANTRFGIASGCKLFTAIAICQLVESGKLSFESKLKDCLDISFPSFDGAITVHHLLTHTSGIPDYFDEEIMEDFEDLWVHNPMYRIRALEDFLPLFKDKPMKLKVEERFHYNNAGYILLGLIVEKTSGLSFADYIHEHVFNTAGMQESGYFEFDSLPSNTAAGYIDFSDGTWKTNIYSLPAKGGSDGGAYITVSDMDKLWDALLHHKLLGDIYTKKLLTPYVQTDEDDQYYGYGVWIEVNKDDVLKYHIMGYDPGVSFHSAYYPESGSKVIVCSNQSEGAYDVMREIEGAIWWPASEA
jgi:CubicO group peptidase (beta-lactamase class C family)